MDNQSIQSPQTPEEVVKPQPASRSNLLTIIVIGLIMLGVGLAGGYFLFANNSQHPTQQNEKQATQISPTVEVVTEQRSNPEFVKRQIDVSKTFWSKTAYPVEITNASETSLIGMKCTERITCMEHQTNCSYTPKDAKDTPENYPVIVTDTKIIEAIKAADKTKDAKNTFGLPMGEVYQATYCETEDKRVILEYKTGGGGGGSGSRDYIGIVENGIVKKVASIEEKVAYFGCEQPIQLTEDNMLYYQCGGGDGPTGSVSLYKVDLSKNNASALLTCSSTVDTNNTPIQGCK